MALTVRVIPGKRFAVTEKVTNPKLNQLGQPTFEVTGTVGTSEITDDSITGDKTVPSDHFYADSVSFAAGVYTLTYSPTPPVVDGMVIAFKANADGVPNVTGIQITIGASVGKKLLKNKTEMLVPGDVVTNQIVEARFDTTGDGGAGAWQMTSHTSNVPAYYTATATGTNAYVLTLTPPASYPFVLADLDGKRIRFKVPNANTGACTVTLTLGGVTVGPKPLKKHFDQPLIVNDLRQYQMAEIVYESNVTLSTDAFQLVSPTGNAPTDSAVFASTRTLIMENQSAAPDSKIVITAEEVVLRQLSNSVNYLAKNVNVTVELSGGLTGANALDTGAEAISTWYYVHLIYNPTTATLSGLLSTAPSAITFPTGYTCQALVGMVRNDAASNLVRFYQHDRAVWINSTNIFSVRTVAVNDTYELVTGGDLTNFRAAVPPLARSCSGTLGSANTADACRHAVCAVNTDGTLATSAGLIFIGESVLNQSGAAGATISSFGACEPFRVPVRGGASYNIQWKASVNTIQTRLNISGYTF